MSLAIRAFTVFTLSSSFIFQSISPCFNHVKMAGGERQSYDSDKDSMTRQNPDPIQGQLGVGQSGKEIFFKYPKMY